MRRAFTLLELLASTALAALLMLAVLRVVGSLGASRAALARQPQVQPWRGDLVETLRRDLTNASQITFGPDSVTLVGHGSLDPIDVTLGHQPVTVVYGLSSLHGRRWLVRRQSSRDTGSNQTAFAELLCGDVASFNIRPAGAIPVSSMPVSVPASLIVSISNSDGPIVDETLVLR
jgi:prepilin-type N-terminal cleavage/methylation domain-containing protein